MTDLHDYLNLPPTERKSFAEHCREDEARRARALADGEKCPKCHGFGGSIYDAGDGPHAMYSDCPVCHGTGRMVK